jgi:hypothetical protein
MTSAGFEPTISATNRPKTYALGRAVTVIGNGTYVVYLLVTGNELHFLNICLLFTENTKVQGKLVLLVSGSRSAKFKMTPSDPFISCFVFRIVRKECLSKLFKEFIITSLY